MIHHISESAIGIEVPEKSWEYETNTAGDKLRYWEMTLLGAYNGQTDLPPGQWSIVCLASECTEEQAKGVVEDEFGDCPDFLNEGFMYQDPLSSLQSFCTSIGVSPDKLLIIKKK